jgi:hypothetical protein
MAADFGQYATRQALLAQEIIEAAGEDEGSPPPPERKEETKPKLKSEKHQWPQRAVNNIVDLTDIDDVKPKITKTNTSSSSKLKRCRSMTIRGDGSDDDITLVESPAKKSKTLVVDLTGED